MVFNPPKGVVNPNCSVWRFKCRFWIHPSFSLLTILFHIRLSFVLSISVLKHFVSFNERVRDKRSSSVASNTGCPSRLHTLNPSPVIKDTGDMSHQLQTLNNVGTKDLSLVVGTSLWVYDLHFLNCYCTEPFGTFGCGYHRKKKDKFSLKLVLNRIRYSLRTKYRIQTLVDFRWQSPTSSSVPPNTSSPTSTHTSFIREHNRPKWRDVFDCTRVWEWADL